MLLRLLVLLAFLVHGANSSVSSTLGFSENLHISPLSGDGGDKVLLEFQFRVEERLGGSATEREHYHVFPKSLAQIVRAYGVDRLGLKLTRGRWQPHWGSAHRVEALGGPLPARLQYLSSTRVGPPGGEVVGVFALTEREEGKGADDGISAADLASDIDQRWVDLLESLSGITCASVNMVRPDESSAPVLMFPAEAGRVRYAQLPREAVCTENLTPWAHLLPCRDRAGIGKLLKPLKLYDTYFHNMHMSVERVEGDSYELVMDIAIVARASQYVRKGQPLTLQDILGVERVERCSVAEQTTVSVYRETDHVATVALDPEPSTLVASPRLSVYEIIDTPVRLEIRPPPSPPPSSPVIHLSKWVAGVGTYTGAVHIEMGGLQVQSGNHTRTCYRYSDAFTDAVKLFHHTMTLTVDGVRVSDPYKPWTSEDGGMELVDLYFSPFREHEAPAQLELEVCVTGGATHDLDLSVEFVRAFFDVERYPPDAARGLDLPAGVLQVVAGDDTHTRSHTHMHWVYSESPLVLLAYPDGSMPFNVIAFAASAVCLLFGTMFNAIYGSPKQILYAQKKVYQLLDRMLAAIARRSN